MIAVSHTKAVTGAVCAIRLAVRTANRCAQLHECLGKIPGLRRVYSPQRFLHLLFIGRQVNRSIIICKPGYQPQNIGIYLNTAYYCTINYDKQEVQVVAYDIIAKTKTELLKDDFHETKQPYSVNPENEYLSFVCSDQIKVLHLQSNEVVFDSALPEAVKYVYGVSYDSKNDTCALYYADNDSEDVGILKEGENDVVSVFTFSQNHYAYQDKIECCDGHIYWIAQANVSGTVTDHYTLIDYNYLEHTPKETDRTFGFYRAGNDFYVLRFNKRGNYTHVDLCQYE